MKKRLLGISVVMLGLAAAPGYGQVRERSGEQIVKVQCAKCHQTGVSGAPKIDDRGAWAPRMKRGLDATVRSAIQGHGKMPARGGLADLTDAELRAAILYMFYPVGAAPRTASPAPVPQDRNTRVVGGMEVLLGIAPAAAQGVYHVNISLRDAASKALIKDAVVQARVANTLGGTTKKLDPFAFEGAPSYLSDFRMTGKEAYTITVQIRRPNAAQPAEATFDFKP
jgi:cytochrome c5